LGQCGSPLGHCSSPDISHRFSRSSLDAADADGDGYTRSRWSYGVTIANDHFGAGREPEPSA
jgi:hypothetical protein